MLDSCYEPRRHKANEVLHDVAPAASFIFCSSSVTNKLPTPTFWIFLYFFKLVGFSHTKVPLHKLLPLLKFSPLPFWDTQLPLTLQIYHQGSIPPSHLLQYPNLTEGLLKRAPTAHIMDFNYNHWCLCLLPSCPGLEGKVVSYRVFTSWHLTKGLAHCRCLVNVQLGHTKDTGCSCSSHFLATHPHHCHPQPPLNDQNVPWRKILK